MSHALPSDRRQPTAREIPAIGFGTSQLGDCADVVAKALELGYRHIDTAWKYGTRERRRRRHHGARGVPREEIFLVTKVSHEYLRADDFARSVDESLENLQVDYVDLLHVHWPTIDNIPLDETMGALAKAKREGKARHIGVANFNIALVEEAMRLCPEPLVTLQAEYHPYLDQSKVLAACRRLGHRVHRVLPARARPGVQRSGARRDRAQQEARPSRRSRCAGSCSRATSPRSRARPTRSTWPRACRCSISS